MPTNNNPVGTRLKTNMAMEVMINDEFSIHVSHKDGMCNLNEVFQYGNERRDRLGKSIIRLNNWLASSSVNEFIESHERLTYSNSVRLEYSHTKNQVKSKVQGELNCLKTTKGHGTRADLLLTIKAAAALDSDLEVLIYTIFITQGILDLRDKGGDNFKRLNAAIDAYLPGREGKSSNKGIYINAAKKIRAALGCESLADWNVQEADAPIHEQRAEVEQRLITLLESDMIEGKDHLWAQIEKQCRLAQNT